MAVLTSFDLDMYLKLQPLLDHLYHVEGD